MADIPYLDTGEGWLSLAGLLNACFRRCVGWQTGGSLAAALVTQAWEKAWRVRRARDRGGGISAALANRLNYPQ